MAIVRSYSSVVVLLLALLSISSSAKLDASHSRSLKAAPFRVIAFGDSTTEGWVPSQKKFMPYTTTLQSLLQAKVPGTPIQVVNKGLGASTVAPTKPPRPAFIKYCKAEYEAAVKQGVVYNWVVVWIGQNDLLLGNTPEAMMRGVGGQIGLMSFFRQVLASGSSLLFVAPVNYKEIKPTDPKEYQRQRLVKLVNAFAVAINKEQKAKKRKNVMKTLDLLAFPATNPWKLSRAAYPTIFEEWHLSEGGYKALAAQIYKKIVITKY